MAFRIINSNMFRNNLYRTTTMIWSFIEKWKEYWKYIVFWGAHFQKFHTQMEYYMVFKRCSVEPQNCEKAPQRPWWGQGAEADGRGNVGLLPPPPLFKQSSFAFIYYIYDDSGNILFGKWVLLFKKKDLKTTLMV